MQFPPMRQLNLALVITKSLACLSNLLLAIRTKVFPKQIDWNSCVTKVGSEVMMKFGIISCTCSDTEMHVSMLKIPMCLDLS